MASKKQNQCNVRITDIMDLIQEYVRKDLYKKPIDRSKYMEQTYVLHSIMYLIDNKISILNVCKDPKILLKFCSVGFDDPLLDTATSPQLRLPASYFKVYMGMYEEVLQYVHDKSILEGEEAYESAKQRINLFKGDDELSQNINPYVIDHIKNPTITDLENEVKNCNKQIETLRKENGGYKEREKQHLAQITDLKQQIESLQQQLESLQQQQLELSNLTPTAALQPQNEVNLSDEMSSKLTNLVGETIQSNLTFILNSQIDELKQIVQAQSTSHSEEYRTYITNLEKEKDELKLKNNSLEEKIMNLHAEIEKKEQLLQSPPISNIPAIIAEISKALKCINEFLPEVVYKAEQNIIQAIDSLNIEVKDGFEQLPSPNLQDSNILQNVQEKISLLTNTERSALAFLEKLTKTTNESYVAQIKLLENLQTTLQEMQIYKDDAESYQYILKLLEKHSHLSLEEIENSLVTLLQGKGIISFNNSEPEITTKQPIEMELSEEIIKKFNN